MKRAVFLDRDGVINELVERDGRLVAPRRVSDFKLKKTIVELVQKARAARFFIVVVTNQPDIATGHTTWKTLNAMHAKMCKVIELDEIIVCPHVDADGCDCRKPKPGMLLEAAQKHNIDLKTSYMFGDSETDMQAARSVGVTGILCE